MVDPWWLIFIPPSLILLVYMFSNGFREEMNTNKVCAFCASKIPKQATTCRYCTKDQTANQTSYSSQATSTKLHGQERRCSFCSVRMPMDAKICLNCRDIDSD